MRAGPMPLEIVVEALGDLVNGKAGRIGRDDRARAPLRRHSFAAGRA